MVNDTPSWSSRDVNPGSLLLPTVARTELSVMMLLPLGALHCPMLGDLEADMHSNRPILPVTVVRMMLLFWSNPIPSRYSDTPECMRKGP